jgi:hypothetical protein
MQLSGNSHLNLNVYSIFVSLSGLTGSLLHPRVIVTLAPIRDWLRKWNECQ